MPSRRLRSALIDKRGIALPLALIVLALLTSLTLAFLAMSATEPLIAANLKGGEQALSNAEAGIERAIWALSNPTVDTAGLGTKLTDLNQIPAAYNNGTLFKVNPGPGEESRVYAIAITVAGPTCNPGPTCITGHGYVLRNGGAVPAQPAGLLQPDIAAQRIVQLQVTSTGPLGGPPSKLPGALTVAGTVQLSGNSLVDGNDKASGTPNSCAAKASVTIRDKTTLANGTVLTNSISEGGSASTVGTPAGTQTPQANCTGCSALTADQINPSLFTDDKLAALKSLAQAQGTYIQPTSNSQFILTVTNGLTFVDTVNGQPLGSPPDASKLASVKITGANNSGWLIVMGSLRIDGNVTYNGLIYAQNDLSYKGTGTGGIFGAMVSANVIDAVSTNVDTDESGNAKIYYDCTKVGNGGGAFNSTIQNALDNTTVTISPGTWREVTN
jgi:hypothetical protein